MVRLHDYSGFQRVLLYSLAACDGPTGSHVHDIVDAEYSTAISRQRVYANLDDLVEAGLVEKHPDDNGWTKTYRVTEAGFTALSEFHAWTTQQIRD